VAIDDYGFTPEDDKAHLHELFEAAKATETSGIRRTGSTALPLDESGSASPSRSRPVTRALRAAADRHLMANARHVTRVAPVGKDSGDAEASC
jgi:hypothetical protein